MAGLPRHAEGLFQGQTGSVRLGDLGGLVGRRKDAANLAAALQKAVDDLTASERLRQIFAKCNVGWQAA